MRVEVVRHGGLMGIALRGSCQTSDLGDPTSAEQALRSLPSGRQASPPRHPDSFRYEITVAGDEGQSVAAFDEAELPEALRPVVDAALAQPPPAADPSRPDRA